MIMILVHLILITVIIVLGKAVQYLHHLGIPTRYRYSRICSWTRREGTI